MGDYRCVASSVTGFIQQLAVSYVANGYFFYVVGRVPGHKDAGAVDRKLIERYSVDISKWSRARRRRSGQASVQYLRHRHLFVLLATHGEHPFFAEEATTFRDLRRVPLKVFGYAVSHRGNRVHVRIEREEFKRLKAYFLHLAKHRKRETIEQELSDLPFEPYAPVRRQFLVLVRAINRERRAAGFAEVDSRCLRFLRRIVSPFQPDDAAKAPTG